MEKLNAVLCGAEIRFRPMMGEYLLYYKDILVGGLYDDKLLLKLCASSRKAFPDAPCLSPYPGAKELCYVAEWNRDTLCAVWEEMLLCLPKKGKKKS